WTVAELLLDGERLFVPVLRPIELAAILRHHPELVIGDGHTWTVAELLLDSERLFVPDMRLIELAALLRHPPELVIGNGQTRPSLGARRSFQAPPDLIVRRA